MEVNTESLAITFSREGARGVQVRLSWGDHNQYELRFVLSVPQLLRIASKALGVFRAIGKDAFCVVDPICSDCKAYLLPDEISYYGSTCNDCEAKTCYGP